MAVSKKKKIFIALGLVLLVAAIITAGVLARRTDAPEIQTAKVEKRPLLESKVTANGEVRPILLINLTAEVAGRVTDVFVKEGDFVKKGQKIVRLDPTQQESSVSVQEGALRASQADVQNQNASIIVAENAINTSTAALYSSQADLERAKVDRANAEIEFKRNAELLEAQIISKAVFDSAKARLDSATASVNAASARVNQAQSQIQDSKLRVDQNKASLRASQARVAQSQANLRSQTDFLRKTVQYASIEGVIANKPIEVGTFAVANFSSTPLVIIADMSTINVEVKVDETDIANIKVGQKAKIKVDALGEKELEGDVVERAASAVTKSGADITAKSGNQEAKEFKVVVRLVNLEPDVREKLRPGMSSTATIYTDRRENIISIPLQSLVERDPDQLDKEGKTGTEAKPTPTPSPEAGSPNKAIEKKKTIKGVFLFKDKKAVFTPVETGITGDNDIEITKGLSGGEEIIIGPYRQLRTLKNNSVVKLEDKTKKAADTKDK